MRNILNKKGGNLASPGSTSYLFTKKGFVSIEKDKIGEDELMNIVLDAGAEDFKSEGQYYEITCEIGDLENIKAAIQSKSIPVVTAEMTMIPSTTVKVVGSEAKSLLGLMEALEDHDDVQNVYANFDIPDEEMEKISQEG
jgi:transcriptional/translational regulatory protein YebC/TACO1